MTPLQALGSGKSHLKDPQNLMTHKIIHAEPEFHLCLGVVGPCGFGYGDQSMFGKVRSGY